MLPLSSKDCKFGVRLLLRRHDQRVRLKNFNFKFLYNIVPVKSNLFKWKLSDDDLCPECNIKEDILHAFLLCERVKAFWKWLGNIIKKLKADYATFNIDSAVMIYGFNIENKTFKLLNFIVNCAMFVIYKCIIVRNFESKQYSFSGLQNMLHQELKNQICNDVKAKYIRKFFSPIEIDILKCYLGFLVLGIKPIFYPFVSFCYSFYTM